MARTGNLFQNDPNRTETTFFCHNMCYRQLMGVGECFNGQFDFKIENSGGYVRFLKLLFTHK